MAPAADAVSRGLPAPRTCFLVPDDRNRARRPGRAGRVGGDPSPAGAVRGAAVFGVRAHDAERTDDAVRVGDGTGRFRRLGAGGYFLSCLGTPALVLQHR